MSPTDPRQPPSDLPPPPAPRERATLLRSVLGMMPALDADVGRRTAETAETAESRERLAHTAERRAWMARDAADAILARDVGVYARALRAGGLPRRQVLAAVVALVREAAAPTAVRGDPLDALVHDAGRYCIAACFAR